MCPASPPTRASGAQHGPVRPEANSVHLHSCSTGYVTLAQPLVSVHWCTLATGPLGLLLSWLLRLIIVSEGNVPICSPSGKVAYLMLRLILRARYTPRRTPKEKEPCEVRYLDWLSRL